MGFKFTTSFSNFFYPTSASGITAITIATQLMPTFSSLNPNFCYTKMNAKILRLFIFQLLATLKRGAHLHSLFSGLALLIKKFTDRPVHISSFVKSWVRLQSVAAKISGSQLPAKQ